MTSVLDAPPPSTEPPPPLMGESSPATVDFDLHGIVGIQLVDPSPSDAAAVRRQLGPIEAALDREPDVVIRFVERMAYGDVRLLGVDDAAFTEDAFLVLRGRHKARVRAQIPLAEIGGQCEVVCESGVGAVPLLVPIINLTALAKGFVPLHAAAFEYRDKGVLVAGWAKGGKTESLLAFMAHGARYIGDEWVYVSEDGLELYGIPEPIAVWDWHLDDLPDLRAFAPIGARARLRGARGLMRIDRSRSMPLGPGRALRRAMPAIERRASVELEPNRIFGEDRCPMRGAFDKLFFVMSDESEAVAVNDVEAAEVARRMTFSLVYERLDLLSAYLKFRFAFPDRRNHLIERAEPRQRIALERAFADKVAHFVTHPYPAPIREMYEAMEPYVR